VSGAQTMYTPSRPLPPARTGTLTGFAPGTRTLEAGFQIAPQFRALPVDVVLDKDVAVQLRDGVTIYVDVFRPAGSEQVPVIVAWSPYGKGQGTSASVMGVFGLVGLSNQTVSGLEKFEAPDPAYWCAQAYAVCNPDVRGVVDSEGDSVLWDRQEGRDCYDLIEWLAGRQWCTGKVGMSGTSYLAVSQWFTAAEQPPHLVAINPWEGVSDVYRDLVMRGGMPDTGFAQQLQEGSFFGNNQKEDILSEVERYPLMTELWENKIPDFDKITVPAYIVASYSNTLHTAGTFRAWRRVASEEKGCASTTARSGPTTTTKRTWRTCAASSTITSRARTTDGRPRPASATRSSTWRAATRSASLRTRSLRQTSPRRGSTSTPVRAP